MRDSSLTLRMTMNNSKLKSQNSKPQLKTLKLSFCHPERSEGSHAISLSCHPEGEARRIPCPAVRDSSLTLRMTIKKSKIKNQRSKINDKKKNAQNDKTAMIFQRKIIAAAPISILFSYFNLNRRYKIFLFCFNSDFFHPIFI